MEIYTGLSFTCRPKTAPSGCEEELIAPYTTAQIKYFVVK